jgi:hypothetical protein
MTGHHVAMGSMASACAMLSVYDYPLWLYLLQTDDMSDFLGGEQSHQKDFFP